MAATPALARKDPVMQPEATRLNETARWRELDLAHHLHPFTDYKGLADEGGSRIIVSGEGMYLRDSEGRRILDGMAGLWNVALGYGRPELARAAYDQMLRLPYYNTFFKTATPPSVELAARLVEITPSGLNHVFFTSSGSEANDTIVRMVRHYWTLAGKPSKSVIISREYGYHGSTMMTASLCGPGQMVGGQGGLPLPDVVHVSPPYWYDYGGDMTREALGWHAARQIEAKIQELGADRVGAVIAEPIQGAGGVIIPPETYWPEVQRICRAHDVLLIADEVICGFGRTGHWFASEPFGIQPDFLTLAKGVTSGYVPLGAVMLGDRVADTLIADGGEFFHGFTYSGHPVACAVGLENLRLIEAEGLVDKVRSDTGPYLAERLADLRGHPIVGEVRSMGLLGAVELCADKATRRRFQPPGLAGRTCRDHCLSNDIILRAVRDSVVMSPALVCERSHIDTLIDTLREALDATAEDLGAT
jgi:putrescine aminotransferase